MVSFAMFINNVCSKSVIEYVHISWDTVDGQILTSDDHMGKKLSPSATDSVCIILTLYLFI